MGGTNWAVLVYANVAAQWQYYFTTDDGTTWSLGGSLSCGGCSEALYDLDWLGGTAVVSLMGSTSGSLAARFTVNYQTAGDFQTCTGCHTEAISDNQGGLTASTQFLATYGASLLVGSQDATGSHAYVVYFRGSADGKTYSVNSDDGYFWTIPYTAAGGSTPAPLTLANCPGVAGTSSSLWAAGNGDESLAWFNTKNGASNIYACSYTSTGATLSYPNAAPSAAQSDAGRGGHSLATNGFGQYIATAREGASNYVLYKSSLNAAWALAYSTASSSPDYAVQATPTQAYYFFTDVDLHGGRLTVAQAPMLPPDSPGSDYWCSDPTSADYGGDSNADFDFNYVEDFAFADDGIGDLEDGYFADADTGDYAFMGKGWDGGTYARTIFRIQADTEGSNSIFRSVYSFETATPSSSSKGSGGTAGDTSGDFSRHIAAKFREDGSVWKVSLEYNNDNLDDGSPIQLGSNVAWTNPNNLRTFSFTLNTAGNGYALIKDETSNQTILNQTLIGSGIGAVEAFGGGDLFYSQWFVVSGTLGLSLFVPRTILDDNDFSSDEDQASSCIIFQENSGLGAPVVIEGGSGTVPGFIANPPGDDDDSGEPCAALVCPASGGSGNLSSTALSLFLGIVIVAAFAASMAEGTGSGAAGIAIFAILGLFIAYALGYVQLWVLVCLACIGIGATFLGIRNGSRSGGM